MGTEVLYPHDCLINRFRVSPVTVPHRRKNFTGNGNCYSISNPKPTTNGYRKPQPRRRSPVSSPRRSRSDGELRHKRRSDCNGDDSYAGSAVDQSPSPRSLPLPSFFNRKEVSVAGNDSFDDSATQHLRRLLRLD